MKRVVVLGSGNGSNFESIVRSLKDVEIVCASDRVDANILRRAEKLGIDCHYVPFDEMEGFFEDNRFDLAVLAGYMRILPASVLEKSIFINIHPSLLPSFKGKDAIQRAFEHGCKVTGVSIHFVDSEVDSGKIIAQYPVLIEEWMNLVDLEQAVHEVEHKLYPLIIKSLLDDKVFSCSAKLSDGCSGGCGGSGCGKG